MQCPAVANPTGGGVRIRLPSLMSAEVEAVVSRVDRSPRIWKRRGEDREDRGGAARLDAARFGPDRADRARGARGPERRARVRRTGGFVVSSREQERRYGSDVIGRAAGGK